MQSLCHFVILMEMKDEKKKGFTLAELLIAISILAIMFIAVAVNYKNQTDRAYDVARKTDLRKMKTAFDEYFADRGCFPAATDIVDENCGTSVAGLSSYMPKLLCDPMRKTAYKYILVDSSNPCLGYVLLAQLAVTSDPDIQALGCNAATGCGYAGLPTYNYGVSSGVKIPY